MSTNWKNFASDRTLKAAVVRNRLLSIPFEIKSEMTKVGKRMRPVFYPTTSRDLYEVKHFGFEAMFDARKSAELMNAKIR